MNNLEHLADYASFVPFTFYTDTMNEPITTIPAKYRRGRGALGNPANRFEARSVEDLPERWEADGEGAGRSIVFEEIAKTAITYNTSPDISFDRSINPYRGCEHGCTYCFARPSHAYLGYSPGLDFERILVARPNIADVLRKELAAKRYAPAPLAIGTSTDPYQPIENERKIMRDVLQVLGETNHPVGITTKGSLIERDIDLIAPLAEKGLARVGISITSLNKDISRAMEPRVPSPQKRLQTIERLAKSGIPVRLMIAPIVPGLTDSELERIIAAGADAGACAASTINLRLPREVAPIFEQWLRESFPERAEKVLARVREVHGGKLYDSRWGHRFKGQGIWADLLRQRFDVAIAKNRLKHRLPPLRTDLFSPPRGESAQLSLFDEMP